MKTRIKLLNDIEIDDKSYKAGQILEVEKSHAGELLVDGSAELHEEKQLTNEDVEKAVKAAVEGAKIGDLIKDGLESIQVKAEESDPSAGYAAPLAAGQKRSKGAKIHAAGMYLMDVQKSAGGETPERLTKAMELIEKAAGTPGQIIAIDPDGGFAVPAETRMELEGATLEAAVVRPSATILPMSTKTLNRTRVQDYTHASGAVSGGAIAYWEPENATLTSSKIQLEQVKHDLQKLTALGYMSHEAMTFSAVSGGLLVQELGKAIAFAEDGAFLTDGTGAGMPQAVMNATAKIAITRSVALSVIQNEIVTMISRLRIKQAGSVKWVANQELLPAFSQLNIAVGTGGAPIWIPSNDASKGFPGTLYGYPVQWSEQAESAGTAGDLILGDFSQYEIGDHTSGPEAAESMHIKFLEAQTAFRIVKYVDGMVSPKKVFTPKNGATRAPFVHLTTKTS